MFKKNYYCLIAGLPDLILNETRKGFTSLEFRNELANQLIRSDYKLLELIFRPYDNRNLLNLLLKRDFQFNNLGNYTEDYLRNQLMEPTDIEEYMKSVIADFNPETVDQSPLRSETRLQELFYSYTREITNEFIKQWFRFDRTLKNIVAAANCRRYGYDVSSQLIPDEDMSELVQALLKEVLRPDIFVDEDLPYLEQILQIAESDMDMAGKEKALDNIRWMFLDDLTVFNYFTIEIILSFTIKLNMVDRWRELDAETGKAFLERLISDLENSYAFTGDFSLIKRK